MILHPRLLPILLCASSVLAVTGCSYSGTGTAASAGVALHGNLHGGQQPVAGATIQLYAASSSGYGAASTPLIGSAVLTDSNGNFNITGDYTCPSGALVYLTATGGNPGITGSQTNSALALMAGLGPCSALTNSTFISVNELTTVASVWALAPFMSSLTAIGSSSTNVQGLANAFASINKLVNTATGAAPGPALPANATLPLSELNTLADVLAVCVNTVNSASTTISTGCSSLFAAATPASIAPTDTVQAALNLAQYPTLGLSTLTSSVVGTGAPFQPTLGSTPPNSWTIAINYTGGGLSNPQSIAADGSGNIWIANKGNNSVTELSPTGAALSGSTGYTAGSLSTPVALALDTSGAPWIANFGNNSVTHMSTNGLSASSFSAGGINVPNSIAIDATGNIWITNSGNSSVSELASTGTAVTSPGYTAGGISQPVAIAIGPK